MATNDLPPTVGVASGAMPQVVIQNLPPSPSWFRRAVGRTVLVLSLLGNLMLYGLYQQYYPQVGENERYHSGDRYAADKIAVIRVDGMITSDAVSAPKKELETAAKDAATRAVVLSVDTPGGTIAGSDELYHAVVEFKKSGKPLVVSMQGMATSGGYYVSVAADRIIADRSCVTGSIGVIASMFNVEKLLKDWGVAPEVVKSGPMKDSGSPFRAMTDDERKRWQELIHRMFEQFLEVVLSHRADKVGGPEKLKQLADGRVYLASEAKELGLIDAIGYEQDAIETAKELAGLSGKSVRIVTFSRPFSGLLDLLMGSTATAQPLDPNRFLDQAFPRVYLLPQ